MGSWRQKFAHSNFYIRLRNWEYWPFGIVQFPIFFYYPWLALRAGSLTFFSASNPGILMGGMFGESKFDVLKLIPSNLVPGTIRVQVPTNLTALIQKMADNGLHFPVIFKPDIGERGFMVNCIRNKSEADAYLHKMKYDFLIQELVSSPLEFGVFYSRLPGNQKGSVTSVVRKEMLSVEGDGKSTLSELIIKKDRAKLQWDLLKEKFSKDLNTVLPAGKKLEINSIGNHCLGTKFINSNHLITDKMNETFDKLSLQIPGFFFGRFDLRCESLDDLENGKIKILELNGCGAEPAHIYDPRFSFWDAVRVLCTHWKTIFNISQENTRLGVSYLPLKEAIRHYRIFKSKTK